MDTPRCQVCREPDKEGTVLDYRVKPEFAENATHKTPLNCYDKFLVCSKCFHLADKPFRSLLRNRNITQEQKPQYKAI